MSCRGSPSVAVWFFFLVFLSAGDGAGAHHVGEEPDADDFISIDCGNTDQANYTEEATGINYKPDSSYITAGEPRSIQPRFLAPTTPKYLQTLRSFPNSTASSRFCYSLLADALQEYLIRVTFMHGDYDGSFAAGKGGLKFDLYVDVNFCRTVNVTEVSKVYVVEVVTVAVAAGNISVCLVDTGAGTPFLSAVELRPVPDTVMHSWFNQTQSLILFLRVDLGTTTNDVIRYPNDHIDRLWDPYSTWADSLNFRPANLIPIAVNQTVENDEDFKEPSTVMQTAVAPANSSVLEFSWDFAGSGAPVNAFYVFLHFAELQDTSSSRLFNIYLNGDILQANFTPNRLEATHNANGGPFAQSSRYQWALNSTNLSNLPPILNALEVYTPLYLTNRPTDNHDAAAIVAIRSDYNVKRNWMGDACMPAQYAWEGLNCRYREKPTRIVGINLSSSGLTGFISSSFALFLAIESLDLSSNNLTGSIPEELGSLQSLRYLNLSGNNLTGEIPTALQQKERKDGSFLSNPHLCIDVTQCEGSKNTKKLTMPVIVVLCLVSVLLICVVIFMVWRLRKSEGNFSKLLKRRRDNPLQLENREFTYSDLERITNNFKNSIGKGAFGTVYHGLLEDGTQVAVKLRSQSSSQGTKEFLAEALNLMRIHHKNLLALVGYCMDGDHLALIYEYMSQGTLHDHLRDKTGRNTSLSWRQRLQIAVEAAQGLDYLHKGCKPPLVHRDVKTTNILLSENFEAKIADFGLSKAYQNDGDSHVSTNVVGTPGYLDPEYYLSYQLNEKSDVYSFGVVLLELITGQPPVIKVPHSITLIHWVQQQLATGNIEDVVDANLASQYDVNSIWKAADVALRCTSPTSHERPSMAEVVLELKESLLLETGPKAPSLNPDLRGKNLDTETLGMSQTSARDDMEYFPGISPAAR